MTEVYRNYIAGQWVESKSGNTFPNTNPANTTEIVGHFQASGGGESTIRLEQCARATQGRISLQGGGTVGEPPGQNQ